LKHEQHEAQEGRDSMSKTAARFTLADIARATRVAKEQGAEAVEIRPDGTIRLVLISVHKDEAKPESEPHYRNFKL
jgi:hypothetical protein